MMRTPRVLLQATVAVATALAAACGGGNDDKPAVNGMAATGAAYGSGTVWTVSGLNLDRGIGLTITRKLVALMGGEIGVSSTPDEGSRFWVKLPLSKAESLPIAMPGTAPAASEPAVKARARGAGQTVLYVEDNPANLALVEYVLRQRRPHLRLVSAHTGELGLSIAEAERPDLIILDISLPNMDGYEVLSILRSRPEIRGTPIFALSANAMQSDVNRGLAAGFDDYLTKPIDVTRLLRTIDDLLERKAAA